MQTASRIPSRQLFPVQSNNLLTLESENQQVHPLKLPFDFQEHKNFENEFQMEKVFLKKIIKNFVFRNRSLFHHDTQKIA